MKYRVISLLLSVIHGGSGLILLMVSAWFIAASAVATAGFNYMLPAVAIRALALSRIASGYGYMWVGHKAVVAAISLLRHHLFKRFEQGLLLHQNEQVDAVAEHVDTIAGFWISWVCQNATSLVLMTMAQIATLFFIPDAAWVIFISICGYLLILGTLCIFGLKISTQLFLCRQRFSNDSAEHFDMADLWHLSQHVQQPDGYLLYGHEKQLHNAINNGVTAVHGMSIGLLLMLLSIQHHHLTTPIAMVPLLLLLSARDWLGGNFMTQPALFKFIEAKRNLKQVDVLPIEYNLSKDVIATLQVDHFAPVGRHTGSVSFVLQLGELLYLSGSSGSGKSSLLASIMGILPSSTPRVINQQRYSPGLLEDAVLIEQQVSLLDGTLRSNLDIANSNANDEVLLALLEQVGLDYLNDLEVWVGEQGLRLSGGERKRIGLIRAALAAKSLWLLDEPFEGVDQVHIESMVTLINRYQASKLIIIASHIQPPALNISQYIDLDSK